MSPPPNDTDDSLYNILRKDLDKQTDRLDRLIERIGPVIDFVESEKKEKDRKSKMYDKIIEHTLGWGVIGLITLVGAYLWEKLKFDFTGK